MLNRAQRLARLSRPSVRNLSRAADAGPSRPSSSSSPVQNGTVNPIDESISRSRSKDRAGSKPGSKQPPTDSLPSFSQIDAELHASGLSLDEIHSAKALIRRHAEANLDVGRARQSTTSRSEPIFKPRPVGNIFKRDLEDARRRQRDERLLRGQNRSIHTSHLALKQLHKKKSAPATSQRIEYKTAESALSTESQTFLAGSGEGLGILSERWDRLDMLEAEARAMGDLTLRGEVKQGALVECRRTVNFIGVILCSIISRGRHRMLLLRSTGEIVPISRQDVQYIFPEGMIPLDLVKNSLASQDLESLFITDLSNPENGESMKNMRMLGRTIRAVELGIERRARRLTELPNARLETLWKHFRHADPNRWSSVTIDQALDFVCSGTSFVPNLADRFAIYSSMMNKPDYFLADETDMRTSGRFSVRPSAEIEKLERVRSWQRDYEADRESSGPMRTFIEEARKAVGTSRSEASPLRSSPLSDVTRTILEVLKTRLVEQRTTQASPYTLIAPLLLRATGLYDGETLDQGVIVRFLRELGELDEFESIGKLRIEEAEKRDAYEPAESQPPAETTTSTTSRHDWGRLPVYVIDASTAQELDDGISIERDRSESGSAWVHIHIADPTHWLSPRDPIAQTAEQRGLTLYLPDGSKPMLDDSRTMGQMSLGAGIQTGEPQPVLTFSAKIDLENGNVLDHRIRESLVSNVNVITYGEAERLLGESGDRAQDLAALRDVALVLKRRRINNGSLEWFRPTAEVFFTSNSEGKRSMRYEIPTQQGGLSSQSIVSELMLLGGSVAARFAAERSLPIPYRGSAKPYVQSAFIPEGETAESVYAQLLATRDPLSGTSDSLTIARAGIFFDAGLLSLKPIDHNVLGIPAGDGGYARVTSPLRRFSDMLIHWQLKHAIAGHVDPLLSNEEMARRAIFANKKEKRFRATERATRAYWISNYIDRYLQAYSPLPVFLNDVCGQRTVEIDLGHLDAVVIDPGQYSSNTRNINTQVWIPALATDAVLQTRDSTASYTIGQSVVVKLAQALQLPVSRLITVPV